MYLILLYTYILYIVLLWCYVFIVLLLFHYINCHCLLVRDDDVWNKNFILHVSYSTVMGLQLGSSKRIWNVNVRAILTLSAKLLLFFQMIPSLWVSWLKFCMHFTFLPFMLYFMPIWLLSLITLITQNEVSAKHNVIKLTMFQRVLN
jgi:hypothetical protein